MRKFPRNTSSLVGKAFCFWFLLWLQFSHKHVEFWNLFRIFSSNGNKKWTGIPSFLFLDDPLSSLVCCYHLASITFWFSLTSLSCLPGSAVAHSEIVSFFDPSEKQWLENFPRMWMQWLQLFEKGPALPLLGKCCNHSAVMQNLHFSCSL